MESKCTVYKISNTIGRKWTLPILLEIYKGKDHTRRYNELKQQIPGITPKILSTRLKDLEKNKIIKKTIDAESFPVKSFYLLTESGLAFIKVIRDIKVWALKYQIKNKDCESKKCDLCELK